MSLTVPDMGRSAVFSTDRLYRYELRRTWDTTTRPAMFVGMNPSTADEVADDPTVRRCIRFARDWGYGELLMANLFAWRATDPKALPSDRPVGDANDEHLRRMATEAGIVVAAWGAIKMPAEWAGRPRHVANLLPAVHVLGLTKDGHPRHPLYIKADAVPFGWVF